MIITRTPFRISFFGGGTDLPAFYEENGGGAVLSTTINKYCYISCRVLPPFFECKHKIVYSKQEMANEINEIIHPSARETLRFMNITDGVSISHDGDLPAMSGLGSSSAFTVGLLHALYALKGKIVPKKRLAMEAIHIEQDMIKENVGSQDQVAVALGGFNKIEFKSQHNIEVTPIPMGRETFQRFQDHFLLFFTGVIRSASRIEADKLNHINEKKKELESIRSMVDEAFNILTNERDVLDFGRLLHESWQLKKSLSEKVSNPYIDTIYDTAIKSGAIGGKILGAGGGGFILFFMSPEDREKVKQALNFLLHVPFRFDVLGSQVIYYTEEAI
ncbi:MAG: kinase [Proteobacteria bacterium]|nr:kinase [Pseudomonadota bacterium]